MKRDIGYILLLLLTTAAMLTSCGSGDLAYAQQAEEETAVTAEAAERAISDGYEMSEYQESEENANEMDAMAETVPEETAAEEEVLDAAA